MLLDPFYQGVQKIFLTPARLEKFFGLQPPVFGFNQVDRSEYDRSGVSGDDAVMTENACDEEKEIDDPQNEYRVSVNETCLESYVPDYPIEVSISSTNNSETNDENLLLTQLAGNEFCSIAPGEGNTLYTLCKIWISG